MDKGIVSRAVASLEEKNLIRRKVSASDRRRVHLFPTPEGTKLYTAIAPQLHNQVNKVTRNAHDPVLAVLKELIEDMKSLEP